MRALNPHSRRTISTATLFSLGIGLFGLACARTAPAPQTAGQAAGNDKRWNDFQQTNQKDVKVGMSAYERRQAQLAEKRKKAETGTDTKATPAPSPSP